MTRDEPPWLDADELAAWVGLIKLSGTLVALADGALRRAHGITGRDYELLHHLSGSDDGARVTDLALVIDDSSSGITHRVNRLADAGLVAKGADPTDGRARRVELTSQGRDLLAAAAPDHVTRVRRWVIDPLDRHDLAEVTRLTSMLRDHLRSLCEAATAD